MWSILWATVKVEKNRKYGPQLTWNLQYNRKDVACLHGNNKKMRNPVTKRHCIAWAAVSSIVYKWYRRNKYELKDKEDFLEEVEFDLYFRLSRIFQFIKQYEQWLAC